MASFDFSSIAEGLQTLHPRLELTLHASAEPTELSRSLQSVAGSLVELSRGRIALGSGADTCANVVATPALTLARAGRGDVHYLALPQGPEEAPFVEAVLGAGDADDTVELRSRLADLGRPAELLVFITPSCPYCPRAVQAAVRLAAAHPDISASVLDVEQFPSLGERFGVLSAPTTLLDEQLSWTGVRTAEEIAGDLLDRGSEDFGRKVFRCLIETGRFREAVRSIEEGHGARHFAAAWRGSTTSLRIGLMLAAEDVLETSDVPFRPVVGELAAVLRAGDHALRGDTADLLSRIDHPEAKAALRPLLDDPDPDIAEIAAEALGGRLE